MIQNTALTEWFRHVPEDKWLRDPAASQNDAQAIWDKLGLKPGIRIFVCPCGKADIGFPLARMGAIMSGMDFNPHFVAAARNKFYRADLPGTFTNDDMRHAVFPHNQVLIINCASSFGYFSDEGNKDLLERFAESLKSGGELLIEVANPKLVMSGRATRLIASGETVPETWDEESRRASVVFPSNEYRGPVVASIRVYTTDEYKEMLKDAGLTLLAFYGQGFTEYTDESTRLIVHAKKP